MAYKYTTFDGVTLPANNPTQDHGPASMRGVIQRSVGGSFDAWGTSAGIPEPQAITLNGVYVGELSYLVDEAGDYLVDETGDYVIAGDANTMLRSQVSDLARKVKTVGTLYRQRLDDLVLQWKTARLLDMDHRVVYSDPIMAANVSCQFESSMQYWHAASVTTASASLTASVALTFAVENAGETVDDATITVTRTSGTITAFTLICEELGISLVWTGSMGSGHVLTIDAGLQTVADNTTDAYSGFSIVDHTAAGWLTLPQGTYLFTATVIGGAATLAINHYDQFP